MELHFAIRMPSQITIIQTVKELSPWQCIWIEINFRSADRASDRITFLRGPHNNTSLGVIARGRGFQTILLLTWTIMLVTNYGLTRNATNARQFSEAFVGSCALLAISPHESVRTKESIPVNGNGVNKRCFTLSKVGIGILYFLYLSHLAWCCDVWNYCS